MRVFRRDDSVLTELDFLNINVRLREKFPGGIHAGNVQLWSIGAFGSRVKGYDHPSSDYDFYAIYTLSDSMAQQSLFSSQGYFTDQYPTSKIEFTIDYEFLSWGIPKQVTVRCISIHDWLHKLTQSNYDQGLAVLNTQLHVEEFKPILDQAHDLCRQYYDGQRTYHTKLSFIRRIAATIKEAHASGEFTGELETPARAFDFAHSFLTVLAIRHECVAMLSGNSYLSGQGPFDGIKALIDYIPPTDKISLAGFIDFILKQLSEYRGYSNPSDFNHKKFFMELLTHIEPRVAGLNSFSFTAHEQYLDKKRAATRQLFNSVLEFTINNKVT